MNCVCFFSVRSWDNLYHVKTSPYKTCTATMRANVNTNLQLLTRRLQILRHLPLLFIYLQTLMCRLRWQSSAGSFCFIHSRSFCFRFAITNTLRLFSHRSTRLDALAVDTNFAKKAEGWVSSCGDVTFWLELMAPRCEGRQFEPGREQGLFFFFFYSKKSSSFFFLSKYSLELPWRTKEKKKKTGSGNMYKKTQ